MRIPAWVLLFLSTAVSLTAERLPDELIRAHDQAWSALVRVRAQAAAAAVQQPWETEAEWKQRQSLAAEEAAAGAYQAWVAADNALRQAEFFTEPGTVSVKVAASKTKGRSAVTVTSKDLAVPFSRTVEVSLAPAALASPSVRIAYYVYGVQPGRYRTIARRMELSPGGTAKPLAIPIVAAWDFVPDARTKPVKANLVDEIEVAPGGTVWAHNEGDTEKTLTVKQGFRLQRTPVTQDFYAQITGLNPSQFKGAGDEWQRPAEMVSRDQARWFCNLLSEASGLSLVYRYAPGTTLQTASEDNFQGADFAKNGWRLPLIEEYTYAAAGGKATKNFSFVGGEDPDAIAWSPFNAGGTTHPVGLKTPNELGLYDMAGNVLEWIEGGGESGGGEGKLAAGGVSWLENHGVGSGLVPHLYADQHVFIHEPAANDLGFRVARNSAGAQ